VKDGTKLGANLKIGQDRNGTDSSAWVNFASSTTNLNSHVMLYKNVTIYNYKQGDITFYQTQQSDQKGGIDKTENSIVDPENWTTR
jgi:hypothetical protein